MKNICPVCHKTVKVPTKEKAEETKFFPFCSRRCKLVDLGVWLDAGYKLSQSQEPGETPNTYPDRVSDQR